jgi:hypothetical protein
MENQISFKGKANELMTYLFQLIEEENETKFRKTIQNPNSKKVYFNFLNGYTTTYEMELN